jgi:long-chain acyl-CoA synthetase
MSATAEAAPAPASSALGDARSLPGLLLERSRARPTAVALRHKDLGRWREYSWAEYADRVARVGLGLLELGVQPGDRVAVHSENRPEWLFADLAIQGIGASTVGVYPTSPAAEVSYLLGHSESRVLIAEDEEQLDKALQVRDELPGLEWIVVIDPRNIKGLEEDQALLTLAQLEAMAQDRDPAELEQRVDAIDPEEVAMVVYTSGTTGPPKGAMLTHRNLLAAAEAFDQVYSTGERDEVLSYLPLCHIAERLFSLIDALGAGYVVNFGESLETFGEDLREVQPTFFLGVPRVWEKMLATVEIRMADATRLKRLVYRFATRAGRGVGRRRLQGKLGIGGRALYALLWALCFGPLREQLGLRRVRIAISGAAPIATQVLEYFWTIGVPVREGYGQTENTAIATYTPEEDVRIGYVGRAVPGVELRVAPDGEILTRSPGVFAGYLKDPDATAAAIDPEGWLHTGDVGELSEDGYLRLTDRKKDIIITAGGKNLSPSEIENALKVSPYVREAVVIGDRRRYLTTLIGIEPDTVGDWATRRGIPYTTYSDLSGREEVRHLVAEVVEGVNRDLARVEQVKRFQLIPVELDHEDGQLTATQKVKRAAIAEQFGELIEEMYR